MARHDHPHRRCLFFNSLVTHHNFRSQKHQGFRSPQQVTIMRDANLQTIYLKDYTVPEYLIHSVALNFALDDENTRVSSRLTLSRNPDSQSKDLSLIHI